MKDMDKGIKANGENRMKSIEICCRKGFSEGFQIAQLYAVLNKDYDIHVHGSIQMTGMEYGSKRRVKVYANLCNKQGAILYVLQCWKNYPIRSGNYFSFSLYCSTVNRFFNPADLDYVEIYLSFNERD